MAISLALLSIYFGYPFCLGTISIDFALFAWINFITLDQKVWYANAENNSKN
jgi:hypothetical protein